jgi:hypothetical protein
MEAKDMSQSPTGTVDGTGRRQHPIQVMVPRTLESALSEEARNAGTSRSEVVRLACEEYVGRLRAGREAEQRRRALVAARGTLARVAAGSTEFSVRRAEETEREDADVRP